MLQGRSIEINRLNDFFSRSESSIVILYGEQLSGISSLVREFAEGKNTTYLSCVPASLSFSPIDRSVKDAGGFLSVRDF